MKETLIYCLPQGETRDFMEVLAYAGGHLLTPEECQKVIDAGTKDGYHSFRVTTFSMANNDVLNMFKGSVRV
jgi:L-alanine-DL-glutamate epimerase-like enolase superfamily enzyme